LAAVLGIVRGHRGRITVASTPQKGSTIEVLFPCSTRLPWDEAESDRREPPRGQGTVLVVDDEPGVRTLARRALESAGFQVYTAEDGRKGLELFAQLRHETVAVLLDLTMPRMDGMEVLAELRRLAPYVPLVVVMSGYSELETSRRFAGMSANGFIQKPFRPHDLIACVCKLLPSRV
jgi:CheY-like chemotaxis protein